MFDAYTRIFTRLGLRFRAVAADTGAIGGSASHEFQVIADSGEDAIAYSTGSDYAANVEFAEALAPATPRPAAAHPMQKVPTPGKTRCEDVADLLGAPLAQTVKAIAVMHDDEFWLLLIRGDHTLNEIKASKVPGLAPFRFATETEIQQHLQCKPGYIGPVGAAPGLRVVADRSVAAMADFICGANEEGFHLTGVNFARDLPEPAVVADIRNVVTGDPSPDGKGTLSLARGIEVGHVFALGTKYSEAMGASFLDEQGEPHPPEMGCYGIGVTRVVGAAIEQNHDERGIIWPAPMAPFQIGLVPIGYHKSDTVREATDALYQKLTDSDIEVLLDDRAERPGVMFAEMELIGLPRRVVISERGLKEGHIEFQDRRESLAEKIDHRDAFAVLRERVA
jgi:prolyl-tRNA synthetase